MSSRRSPAGDKRRRRVPPRAPPSWFRRRLRPAAALCTGLGGTITSEDAGGGGLKLQNTSPSFYSLSLALLSHGEEKTSVLDLQDPGQVEETANPQPEGAPLPLSYPRKMVRPTGRVT